MTIDEQILAYKELLDNGQAFFVDNYEDAERIIEALEKYTQKRPNIKVLKSGQKTYNCPSCDCDYNRFYIGKEYCMWCGQKIDWEGVEE